jgi:protein ImuB
MRTLCLKFSTSELQESQAELFLPLTPSIVYRGGWLFLEISATSHLHGGEEPLVEKALQLVTQDYVEKWALASTPYAAQALCEHASGSFISPLRETEALGELPLEALLNLEGLKPWEDPSLLRSCIDFFYALGFHKIEQILSVSAENFGWRWGTIGQTLWRRLHHKEDQSFPFLVPQSPMKDYAHLDHPVDQIPLALYEIQKIFERLIRRLEGRHLWAWRWNLTLHCEYSEARHYISLQPSKPHRSLSLALTMLEHKLSSLDLSNPLKEVEVELDTCPENIAQLDFFEPRTHQEEDQLYALLSLLGQEAIPAGFFQVRDHIFPEKSFELTLERTPLQTFTSTLLMQEGALRYLPRHSESLQTSPRPCCFLKEPRPLSEEEVSSLRFLSSMPLERLQSPWWNTLQAAPTRDYYVAHSPSGQSLWIYQDTQTHEYYLHGYFD